MDWFKKKAGDAKQAATQAAAKMQNKRTSAFKGEGNVLGGGAEQSDSNGSGSATGAAAAGAKPAKVSPVRLLQRRARVLGPTNTVMIVLDADV